jgi:hypothetical protein
VGVTPAEELSGRQRRYIISMAIRTLCFVGAVVIDDGWLRWLLVAGAVFLPYAAVIMANASGSSAEDFSVESPGTMRLALSEGQPTRVES